MVKNHKSSAEATKSAVNTIENKFPQYYLPLNRGGRGLET